MGKKTQLVPSSSLEIFMIECFSFNVINDNEDDAKLSKCRSIRVYREKQSNGGIVEINDPYEVGNLGMFIS